MMFKISILDGQHIMPQISSLDGQINLISGQVHGEAPDEGPDLRLLHTYCVQDYYAWRCAYEGRIALLGMNTKYQIK